MGRGTGYYTRGKDMVSRYLLQEGVLPSREVERPKSLDLWT